jgi:hypothetical protein
MRSYDSSPVIVKNLWCEVPEHQDLQGLTALVLSNKPLFGNKTVFRSEQQMVLARQKPGHSIPAQLLQVL